MPHCVDVTPHIEALEPHAAPYRRGHLDDVVVVYVEAAERVRQRLERAVRARPLFTLPPSPRTSPSIPSIGPHTIAATSILTHSFVAVRALAPSLRFKSTVSAARSP
jgi:hypothetical protein